MAQCLGFQDIWDPLGPLESSDTSRMTLWHAGTLLACWHAGTHTGTVDRTHGIQTNDDHHPLNLVDFRLQAVVVGLQFIRFMQISVYLRQSSETAPTPKTEKYSLKWPKSDKPGLYRTKNELAHTN